jgi:ribbon-helix-helix CopG family protein
MDLTPYLAAVRTDLEAIAGSDEAALAVGERLARALEPSLQLRLLDALGQAAQELSEQLPSGRVEVRLAGQDVHLSYAGEEPVIAPPSDEEGGSARVTLRLPESMKARVEHQANREGVSTNAWLVRAVTRGLEQQRRRVGNRITGMAQS